MSSSWRRYLVLLLALVTLVSYTFAQETTAGMQGVVKDPTGAVVSKATVEVTSPALIGVKKLETDASGYYRFSNLPPGVYTLTVTAPNFRGYKQADIDLATGHLPTIDVTLQVGMTSEVVEVSGEAPAVDITQSKVQTNITEQVMDNIPKGRSFQSLIQFAPGARYEPLQTCNGCVQGFQIDGASTSENSYLVEGQETSSILQGRISTNVPIEFIQEMQVKTSGFEAEFGGALGGVVNVIQKRGSNTWHGSIVTYYQGDFFNAGPSRQLRQVPGLQANAGGQPKLDIPYEYFQPKKDHMRIIQPGFETGGYLKKDKLWVFASFLPEMQRFTRTVNMKYVPAGSTGPIGNRTFPTNYDTYYSLARADFMATQKVRLYGAWQYAYRKASGTTVPGADSPFYTSGNTYQYNTTAGNNPDNYNAGIGYTQPNRIYNVGADITITPSLVATSRFGYQLTDYSDKGLPTGIRYVYRDTNYPYSNSVTASATTPNIAGVLNTIPSAWWGGNLTQNMASNVATSMQRRTRYSFTQDVAWFKKTSFGTHNFKVGYGFNRLHDHTVTQANTAFFFVGWNDPYTPLEANQGNCATIRAQNVTRYGAAGTPDNTSCTGLYGTFNVAAGTTEITTPAIGWNHNIYFQDAWTVGHGVTLNLGIRFDKESLPPYDTYLGQGFKGISFGFPNKVAPRLGGAWDIKGNGKFKLFASYGWFYDIMKFSLPQGSFGGQYWHDCVYTLDTYDLSQIQPTRDSAGFLCPPNGPVAGGIPATAGRFIENQDYRAPSNDPNNYLIDPNLKPMKQHEYAVGLDWAISPAWTFESRYSRKRLDRTIEDAGIQTPAGEQFYIVNPGEGIHVHPLTDAQCPGCPAQPKASRRYDGIEFRITRRETAGGHWFGTFSYTYSRLYGNYAGLASSDVFDSTTAYAGRTDPNNNRSFDEPYMQFDTHGRVVDGPLGTDRPHTFKGFGYYRLKWWKFNTLLGGTQLWFQGTPLSTYMAAGSGSGAPMFLEGRGKWVDLTRDATTGDIVMGKIYDRRTPSFSQTDLNFVHEMHVSKTNENLMLSFNANITNVFNQKSIVSYWSNGLRTSALLPITPGNPKVSGVDYKTLETGFDWLKAANGGYSSVGGNSARTLGSRYGQPSLFQDGRSMIFALKFKF